MTMGKAAGGNCVAGSVARTESGNVMSIEEALGFISAGREAMVRPGAREFATRILPLLRLIGIELDAQPAVYEIERKLAPDDRDQS